MNCPECGSNNVYCVDSRDKETHLKRRRECLECFYRFNTLEITEAEYKALKEKETNLQWMLELLEKNKRKDK